MRRVCSSGFANTTSNLVYACGRIVRTGLSTGAGHLTFACALGETYLVNVVVAAAIGLLLSKAESRELERARTWSEIFVPAGDATLSFLTSRPSSAWYWCSLGRSWHQLELAWGGRSNALVAWPCRHEGYLDNKNATIGDSRRMNTALSP